MFKPMYDYLDVNKDGKVTPNEIKSIFNALDTNNDQTVSQMEFITRLNKGLNKLCDDVTSAMTGRKLSSKLNPDVNAPPKNFFDFFDTQRDGEVNLSEMYRPFTQMDENKNFIVEPRELIRWLQRRLNMICVPYVKRTVKKTNTKPKVVKKTPVKTVKPQPKKRPEPTPPVKKAPFVPIFAPRPAPTPVKETPVAPVSPKK